MPEELNPRIIKYTEAIREATDQMMAENPDIFFVGLGATYKNAADNTMSGLAEKYPSRVLDVPNSEGGWTGMAVGAAISGLRPIVHHGRVEFSLLASDQIFTQAAKWNSMSGGGNNVPIVFRINVGRQWGNGPQHTQSLYGLFGNVPGLKVVIPSTPHMAKGLLISALREKNPVVILEPRWNFQVKQYVNDAIYSEPLDKAKISAAGKDITVVAYGDGFIAAHETLSLIGEKASVELIDLVSLNPIDYETIFSSVQKTGRLLCVDTTTGAFNIASEIISKVAQKGLNLKEPPITLSCPNVPCPTSTSLTAIYYPTKVDIANAILSATHQPPILKELTFEELHLAPSLAIPKSV